MKRKNTFFAIVSAVVPVAVSDRHTILAEGDYFPCYFFLHFMDHPILFK